MGEIVLTGIGADWALPDNYMQVNLGVGPVGGAALDYPILLLGNMITGGGDATPDTQIYGPNSQLPLSTEADWISRFGTGSELHRMFLRITDSVMGANNQTTAIYAVAVTASAGTAATAVLTIAGTAIAPGGVVTFWMGDEFVQSTVNPGDTPTVIALNLSNQINTKTRWPVTSNPAAGVITITARTKGPRGNWLRWSAAITPGITSTVNAGSNTAPAFFTGGATADDNTLALATISAHRYFYVVSAAEDATQFGAVCTQLASQALPITGFRQAAFAGYNGTQANGITIATGVNNALAEIIHLQNSDMPPHEMAAHAAANYASYEPKPKPRHNFNKFGNAQTELGQWKLKAPRDGTSLSPTALNTSLKNGLTPIAVNQNGTTCIAKRITTRCLNGSNPDFRSRDSHKRTVAFYFADDLQAKLATNLAGMDLTDDPAVGQHIPGETVTTQSRILGQVYGLVDDYNDNDQLKNADTIKQNTDVVRSGVNNNRVGIRVPLQVIDTLDQTTTSLDQVG